METVSLQKKDQAPPPPEHIAIIMDGNGRWAQAQGLPRTVGHQRGATAVKKTVKASIALGVRYLTLFGFSSENWKRPASEIKDLMGLLRFYLKKEIEELDREGICFKVIGDRTRLESDIIDLIEEAETKTAGNSRLTLTIALSYGGRAEITTAARRIAEEVNAGTLDIEDIDENVLAQRLYTADMPDPDMLIRTSGEERISNFLLWQLAYSELVFTDVLWPEFSGEHLENAVMEFHTRERRYGATGG
ncbi:MAG: isoprenyl transferase [Alphaproteobacteria bacterium]|nr:isoprenyl transferase [Alphaproteobacteria bacterium]MBT7942110.1 isoprenyl transferase [Alphaproteobacteria bacterium]